MLVINGVDGGSSMGAYKLPYTPKERQTVSPSTYKETSLQVGFRHRPWRRILPNIFL